MTILSTNTLNRALSSPTCMLDSVKDYETEPETKIIVGLLSIATLGAAYGLYAIYTHYRRIEKQQIFAGIASGIAHASLHDLERGQIKIQTEQGSVRFKQVREFGKEKIKISVKTKYGRIYNNLPDITSLQELQNRVILDMVTNQSIYSGLGFSYRPAKLGIHIPLTFNGVNNQRIQKEEIARGGNLSEVKKITYTNKAVYFFKPLHIENTCLTAALYSGISDNDTRYADRSMLTYVLSEILELDVVPKTGLSKDGKGKPGYIQEKAAGISGEKYYRMLRKEGEFGKLLKSNRFIRQMITIQLLDALTGQVDRHMNNYFIDPTTLNVTCIDNDAAFGHLTTHPNTMIPTKRVDGFIPANLTEQEISAIHHLQHNTVERPVDALKKYPDMGHAVFLPPVMDKDMVDQFKNLNYAELLSIMSQFNFNQKEIIAACLRLKAIHFHIQVLEKREEKGFRSIIEPTDWNSPETLQRLFPQEGKKVGKALCTYTSYLARDICDMNKNIKKHL